MKEYSEEWKYYKTTHNRWGKNEKIYEVSNYGNLRINGVIVIPKMCGKYYIVGHEYLHRIIANLFIPNYYNKPQVDHIDTNRLNNRIDNLCWVTPFENSNNKLTKQHQRIAQHGKRYSKETRNKHGMYARGTRWMNNGKDQMRVYPPWDQDMLIFGWQYGRLK